MARRKKVEENNEAEIVENKKPTHFISYTNENGEKVKASFHSEHHANLLRHRLTANAVPHTYEVNE